MNKKKILSLALVVCVAAILAIGGTLAYFTDTDEATNTFTVGNVMIDLTEPNWEAETDHDDVYPGEALAKDPTVANVGDNPCFVRVKVTGLDQFGEKGDITLRYIDADGIYHDGYNTTDWTYKDGYYYFNKLLCDTADLDNGYNDGLTDKTTPVFSQIVMPFGLEGDEETQPIVVTAEAVQAQGARASYSAVKAMTVDEIAAWFAESMSAAE